MAGTQADVASKNALHVIKVSEMRRTMHDTDSEGDSDVDEDAVVDFRSFAHPGGVNRVRVSGCVAAAVASLPKHCASHSARAVHVTRAAHHRLVG